MNPDHFVYDMSPGELVKNLDIGVRYHVDCSTEYPVSHGLRVKVLHEMELRRLPYYFTVHGMVLMSIGILLGLSFLRHFYLGGSLMFGPTLLMIMLRLVGCFMSEEDVGYWLKAS